MYPLNLARPYPDELFYSCLARHARHHLAVHPQRTLSKLLQDRTRIPSALLPIRIAQLDAVVSGIWGLGRQQLALSHTLLPYYLVVKPAADRAAIMEDIAQDRTSELSKTLGLNASRIKGADRLRYCPRCVEEDRDMYGESYWHRAHQLPGVRVCPTHGTALRTGSALVRPTCRQALAATESVIDLESDPCEAVDEADRPLALEFARRSQAMLERGACALEDDHGTSIPTPWRPDIHGYGPKDLRDLQEAFVAHFGIRLLRSLEPGWSTGGRIGWLAALACEPRRPLHPLRWVLLEQFLASGSWGTDKRPFGAGPWLCRNPLAEHHGQRAITHLERVFDHKHPERTIGRFRCDCGFVFTRYAEDDEKHAPIRVADFGPLYPERARLLAASGWSTRAIAGELGVAWQTADRFLHEAEPAQTENTRVDPTQPSDRGDWVGLIKANPGEGAGRLRKLAPALYARLYRSDRVWLKAHSPRAQVKRAVLPRVNWAGRDCKWAVAFAREAERLLAEEPRVRVTRTILAKRLGCQATVEKNLYRLPQTRDVLERVCESREAYRERRLRETWRDEGADKPCWWIVRQANLRPALLTPGMLSRARATSEPQRNPNGTR